MKINKFDDFMECRQSGRMLINPYWLEYLLNLFHQEYMGEVWEEIMDTKINFFEMIEGVGYGVIGNSVDWEEKR